MLTINFKNKPAVMPYHNLSLYIPLLSLTLNSTLYSFTDLQFSSMNMVVFKMENTSVEYTTCIYKNKRRVQYCYFNIIDRQFIR